MVSFSDFRIVTGIDGIIGKALSGSAEGIANPEPQLVVDDVFAAMVALVDQMVLPHRVDEEGLHHVVLRRLYGIDGVHQVGVVQHHLGRLFREVLASGVDDVEQSGIGQILDVVHGRGATCPDVAGELRDVGRLVGIDSQEVEQLLDLCQIFQLYLLDEQDVHLGHHVHGFQQVFRVVAVLEEEGIEAMMQIVLKVKLRRSLGKNLPPDVLVALQNVVERVSWEVVARLEVEKLSERESPEVVRLDDTVELGVLLLQLHDARPGEDNLQFGIEVVASTELTAPVLLLEHLVDEQHPSAFLTEFAGEVDDAPLLEVEVVHVQIEAFAVAQVEMFLGVLQQECRLAHTSCPLDANQAAAPVNLVHEQTSDGCLCMFYQVVVCPKKCFHLVRFENFAQRYN